MTIYFEKRNQDMPNQNMPNHNLSKHDMAWNEPGGNDDKRSDDKNRGSKDNDPWKTNRGNRGNQGPPDLDEVFKNVQKKFGSLFGGKGGGFNGNSKGGGIGSAGGNAGVGIGLVAIVLLGFWIATGFYKIEEAERGLVFRFGAHVETVQKGLHWHLPVPIERVEKVDVTKVYTIPINATMLTQDENIVDIHGTVQYQIDSAEKYAFNVRHPEISLSQVTESALRQSIGRSKMDYVITEGRGEIALQVKDIIQSIVNNYQTGLIIFKVNIQSAKPPEEVKAAFDDVTQAREDEERFKNEAEAYRNEIIPKARGAAARMHEEAVAYKNEVTARAEGEANRFNQLLVEYKKAPEITRDRLYLDMMENVLSNSSKVMVDVKGGNNLLYLPLDKLMERQSSGASADQKSSADILRDIKQRGAQQNDQRRRVDDLRSRGARK